MSVLESAGARGSTAPRERANWLAIARRDFADVRRSKVVSAAIGLFVAFVTLVVATSSTSGDSPAVDALWSIHGIAIFFVPILVLVVAYRSIAGECESGRIQYLLGWPITRRDVILGKFLSRSLVAILAVAVAMGIGTVIVALRYPSVPLLEIATLTALMAFFAVVYTGIAVGVSALARTRGRALGGVVGIYVLFTVLWGSPNVRPMDSLAYLLEDLLGLSARPNLYEFVYHLSPSFAYSRLANGLLFERGTDGAIAPPEDAPFYLTEWFMPAILLLWLVLTLAVGYRWFREAELA